MRNIGSVRAAGIVALVALAGAGVPGSAAAVDADPGTPVTSLSLPVPASDVSRTDTDLADTAREVVVVSPGVGGPEVRKLRARTQAEAVTLARALDARPGVVAQVNRVVSLQEPSPSAATKPAPTFPRISAARSALAVGLGSEPLGAQQWGMGWVNAEKAWTVTRGSGVVVAVVDTGVDSTHPDLSGQLLPQADFVPDGLTGDPQGHGTHVAGIIVAAINGQGIAGVANQTKVLPVRVLDATGTGDDFTISAGIHAAVDSGARVLNMSLGGDYTAIEAEAIKYAVDHDVTVVAAGGNSYLEGNPVNYPAALPGVLAVSSLSPQGASSEFANAGSYIDLVAPGEQIASTIPGGWALMSGTSMASPFVAATAALTRAANPTLTKADVDAILTGTALDDPSGNGWDQYFGFGLVQADRAALNAATRPGGIREKRAAVYAKAVSSGSKLYLNVNPNKGSGYWRVTVQKKRTDGTWRTVGTYRTYTSKETRTLDLSKGTYRVWVNPKYGYSGAMSTKVRLAR